MKVEKGNQKVEKGKLSIYRHCEVKKTGLCVRAEAIGLFGIQNQQIASCFTFAMKGRW